ncbi:hypothetical protein H4R18_005547 [Coemansia javaensis]|uniref:Uncharacterized protein n=1 Tax=Coemansia javaensis TaxID=2761396 RepID=A0A9W8LF66_9FUNG|nr:hypothetical protein H4R18_005547 [Coemansia javaensis]
MRLFDGLCAWFAPNVPAAHIDTWVADGGVQIRDADRAAVQYYFSNSLDDEQTLELVRTHSKVVYRSAWVADSSVSRTRQPLGAYALLTHARRTPAPPSSVRRPHTVARRATLTRAPLGSPNFAHPAARRPHSEYYASPADAPRFWDSMSDTHSIRSRCSSRLSNSSSVVSGRRQHIVSRFVIHADRDTCRSILANVADFTPNAHGFVAYKIPKLS